jgi:hypothetical protein
MPLVATAPSAPAAARPRRRQHHVGPRSSPRRRSGADCSSRRLGAYCDGEGRRRELVAVRAARGSTIVLDSDAATGADRRLVAHLGAEEPRENAELVCRHYLADPDGRWCRALQPEDLLSGAPGDEMDDADLADDGFDAGGWRYRLLAIPGERSLRQLRWCRRPAGSPHGREWEQTSLRDIVGSVERYEPARTLTAHALMRHREDGQLQLRRLESEYERLCTSPIVLNRALREAVLRAIERDDLSMSELALRCGILKRDRRGRVSGETSWLARRVGLMAEGGSTTPTPWVHSDVLALIARRALRVSPLEVEVS